MTAVATAAVSVSRDRLTAALRRSALALPLLLIAVSIPAAESPFGIPKRALLTAFSFALFFFAAAFGRLRPLGRWALVLSPIPAATLLAWAASPRSDLGPQTVLMCCAGPLLAWAVASVFDAGDDSLVAAIGAAIVFEAALATLQWATGFDLFRLIGRESGVVGRMRVFGTLGNPDFVAIYLAAGVPALLVAAVRARGARRSMWWTGVFLSIAALAATASRTGIAAAVVGAAVVLLIAGRNMARAKLGIALLVAVVLLGGAVAWRNPRSASTAGLGRVFTWSVALIDVAHRPLGDGPGTFAYTYPEKLGRFVRNAHDGKWQPYIGYERSANNDFVQALSETGWPGLVALVTVFTFAFRRAWQRRSSATALAALGSVAAIATAALAESPLQRAETWSLLWLAIGVSLTTTSQPSRSPRDVRIRAFGFRVAFAAILFAAVTWLAAKPVLATIWSDRGSTLEARGDYPAAAGAYRRAMAYDPSASSAAFNLPRALSHVGDLEGAASAFPECFRWIDEPELHLMQIRILEKRGSYVAALHAAFAAVERFPYSPELRDEFLKLPSLLTSP